VIVAMAPLKVFRKTLQPLTLELQSIRRRMSAQ
jgi:hypothetical protein